MITPSFGLTATERVLPKLALDFTTALLDSRITFTRTTGASNPATYTDNNGYIVSATDNQPRFDYDPITLVCKGLLIEEQRTNSFLQSNNTAVTWSRFQLNSNGTGITGPDNVANSASKLIPNTASNEHYIYQTTTPTGTSSVSVYAKKGELNYIRLFVSGVANAACTFDLQAGTFDAPTGTAATKTGSIKNVGNGFYRCILTASSAGGASGFAFLDNSKNSTFASNGTDGLYLWGAQLEAGAFATSYIPTTTAALTRNADVATMTGTNFSDWYNASEGTFNLQYARVANAVSGKYPYAGYIYSDANNRFDFYQNSNANESMLVRTSGSTVASANFNVSTANQKVNNVLAYKQNSFGFSINAANTVTDSLGNVPTVSTFVIGGTATTGFELNGWMQKINYWPQRITNAEVQAFSK